MKSHIETTVIPSLLSRLTTNSQRKHKNAAKSSALCNPSLFHSMLCKEGTFFSEWNGELRPESVGSVQIVCTNSTDLKNFLCLRTLLPLPTQCSWWAPRCAAVTQTARGGLSVSLKIHWRELLFMNPSASHTPHTVLWPLEVKLLLWSLQISLKLYKIGDEAWACFSWCLLASLCPEQWCRHQSYCTGCSRHPDPRGCIPCSEASPFTSRLTKPDPLS